MAAFGFTREDYVSEQQDLEIRVLPGNELAVSVFIDLMTQWRIGMTGMPTGLDYSVVPTVMRLRGVHRNQWNDLFDSIRIMESEALSYFVEKAQ